MRASTAWACPPLSAVDRPAPAPCDALAIAARTLSRTPSLERLCETDENGAYTALIQVCGTTPCALRGANDLMKLCHDKIGAKDHLSADGLFTWQEVECLGACVNAPMAQINDYYYEDLTPETLGQIIDDFRAGKAPKAGSYDGRHTCEPKGGATTLSGCLSNVTATETRPSAAARRSTAGFSHTRTSCPAPTVTGSVTSWCRVT